MAGQCRGGSANGLCGREINFHGPLKPVGSRRLASRLGGRLRSRLQAASSTQNVTEKSTYRSLWGAV